jgi:Flp pilus assembly protein TadB
MSLVTDLLAGVAEFFADVWLFRRQRQKRGHAERDIADDAMAVAHFVFVTLLWIALVCLGLVLLLIFGLGVPVGWGFVIGGVVAAVWGYRKYAQMLREP